MKPLSALSGSIVISALVMATPLLAQSEKPGVRSFQQFDEVLDVPRGGAKALSAIPETPAATVRKRVKVQQWIIDGGQRVPLPGSGVALVELKAGELTTVIDGKRQERREGEFWTVPEGSTMTIETEDDAVIIETTAVSDPEQ